jgi:hypothetical protein
MIDEYTGARLMEEAGYVIGKESVSSVQNGGKIHL